MPTSETLKETACFWATYFGCRPEELESGRTVVHPHEALKGYDGALVFRHDQTTLVSVPDTVPPIERSKLRGAPPAEAFKPKFLAKVFVVGSEKVSGPAWIGIADPSDYRPVPSPARLLGTPDKEALGRLAEACGEVAWKQSKLMEEREPMIGVYAGSEIMAASGYLVLGKTLAYIGVVTHPDHRGKGFAKQVVSVCMKHAFDQGLVAMWRTPEANVSAVRLARSLGFHPYASTYDVQLTEDEF